MELMMDAAAQVWVAWIGETTARVSLVLLLAGGLVVLLKRSTATLRHLVWALALGGTLVLPVVASVLPALQVPVPFQAETVSAPPPISSAAVDSGAEAALGEDHVATVRWEAVEPDDAGGSVRPSSTVTRPAPRGSVLAALPTWSQVALGIWFVGALLLATRVVVGLVAAYRLGRRATPPRDPEWARLASSLTRRLRLTRPVRLLGHAEVAVPVTWGWRRPVVLVPDRGEWSTERKRVVLLHELSHVRRLDCLSQLVAQLVCAVYWFNPLVWIGARALRLERERACDDAVVADGTPASRYAEHLLEIARAQQGRSWPTLAAVAMARPSQLEGRLMSVLASGKRLQPTRWVVVTAAGTMVAGIGLLASATPVAHIEASPEPMMSETPLEPRDPGVRAVAPAAPQPPSQTEPDAQERADQDRRALLAEAERESAERAQVERLTELERERQRAEVEQGVRDRLRAAEADLEAVARAQFDRASELRAELEAMERLHDSELVNRAYFEAQRAVQDDLRVVFEDRVHVLHQGANHRPLDPRVVDLLMESLGDPDAEVRAQAARGLGRNRVTDAVEPLTGLLDDAEADVRQQAAHALGLLRAETAVGPLAEALDDVETDVAEQAAWALGVIRVEAAVGPLTGALNAADPDIREQAAWSLGRIRSPAAVDALGRALDDSELSVRVEAVEALGHVRDAAAVAPLMGALNDSEPRVRREAAEALGRTRSPEAVDALVAALGDPDAPVADAAAESLGMIRDARAVDGLVGALGHSSTDVAREAAEALGRIRSPASVDGLVAALPQADDAVAREIVEALGRVGGDQALEALIEVTGDASPEIRRAVIEALSGRRWSGRVGAPAPAPDAVPAPDAAPAPQSR